MANGIDDLFQQEDQGGGITDIAIEAGKDQASIKAKEIIDSFDPTGFLSKQIKAFDLRNLGEALAEGDTESARDIFYNEVSQLQDTAPLAVLSSLGITNNPLGNVLAAGNLANNAVQKFAMGSEIISGMDIPGDNIFSSGIEKGLDFLNKPIQTGANIFGTGITQATGDYQNMMNNVLFNTPYYKFMANQAAKPFDLLYNIGLPSFFDRDKKPDPPVIVPPPIVQPPIVNPNTTTITSGTGVGGGADASLPDFPIIGGSNQGGGSQGGGSDSSGYGSQSGGSSFKPPSTNVQEETDRINDILDRRAQGSSQGFNSGGLVSISRYLKGR